MVDAKTIQKAFVFYQRALSTASKEGAPSKGAAHLMALRAVVGYECGASDADLVRTWDEARPWRSNQLRGGIRAIILAFADGQAPEVTRPSTPAHLRRSGGQINAEELKIGDHILYRGIERIVTATHQDRHMLNVVLDRGQQPPNFMAQVDDHIELAPPPPPSDPVPTNEPVVGEIPGGEYWWCSCGKSQNQPFCDGSHETADTELTPLHFVVSEKQEVALCTCKKTSTPPFCDGSHKNSEADPDETGSADWQEALPDLVTEVEAAHTRAEADGTFDEPDKVDEAQEDDIANDLTAASAETAEHLKTWSAADRDGLVTEVEAGIEDGPDETTDETVEEPE